MDGLEWDGNWNNSGSLGKRSLEWITPIMLVPKRFGSRCQKACQTLLRLPHQRHPTNGGRRLRVAFAEFKSLAPDRACTGSSPTQTGASFISAKQIVLVCETQPTFHKSSPGAWIVSKIPMETIWCCPTRGSRNSCTSIASNTLGIRVASSRLIRSSFTWKIDLMLLNSSPRIFPLLRLSGSKRSRSRRMGLRWERIRWHTTRVPTRHVLCWQAFSNLEETPLSTAPVRSQTKRRPQSCPQQASHGQTLLGHLSR